MAPKRRDSKGRLLKVGESQRSDGMYMYRYNDAGGVRRTIYSWRLVDTDKLPTGKKAGAPLRDLEKQLIRDTDDGIESFAASKKTLDDFFYKYMAMKKELKPTTRAGYIQVYNNYIKSELGSRSISSIKYSDVKQFYLSMYYEKEFKPNTIHAVNTVLHPIFTLAVRDGYIRTNPAYQVYAELKKQNGWGQDKRHALTEDQQQLFVDFIRCTPKYAGFLNLFTVFLGTGCRVGEIIGLRWEDCDFEDNIISINHNMAFCKPENEKKMRFLISTPKTDAGTRVIPMLREVKSALISERLRQMAEGFNRNEVDGTTGFIFQTKRGNLYTSTSINQIINRIIRDCNAQETAAAKKQKREPILLPHFSVHNLRHTFCTRFCENETNLKIIQEIMGHANISTTMDVYNEATMEKKKASFENLEGKIKIG